MNSQVEKIKHKSVKHIVKRSLQHIAATFGRHSRAKKGPQLLILMYHRILPLDDKRAKIEEPGMVVTPETFKLHVTILKEHFNIIKLSDWAQLKQENKPLPVNACAITFDDGWADNYEFAFPILQELNIPATIFLVSDMIGTRDMFWPERLARLITTIARGYQQYWSHPDLAWLQKNPANYKFSKTPATREELSALVASAKNFSDQEIHDRLTHIEETLQLEEMNAQQASLLNWQQVKKMQASGLIEIGSHTCRHIRLNAETSNERVKAEIINSKKQIEKNIGQEVKSFCFPNGDFSSLSFDLVKQNYQIAVTTQTGWNTAETDTHKLQRIGVHQDVTADKTAFLARISGWM